MTQRLELDTLQTRLLGWFAANLLLPTHITSLLVVSLVIFFLQPIISDHSLS